MLKEKITWRNTVRHAWFNCKHLAVQSPAAEEEYLQGAGLSGATQLGSSCARKDLGLLVDSMLNVSQQFALAAKAKHHQ